MEQSFMKVMRGIGEALKLDDEQNQQAAYIQYVECILSIASNLLQNVRSNGNKVLLTPYVEKQIMLGKQCMDRISTLFQEFNNAVMNKNEHEFEKSDGISRFAAPVPPLHIQPSSSSFSLKRNLSPTEIAYRQNQSLMRAYKARLATMSKNNAMAANLSLTVQRKLAENLAIANAQERALSEKMKETQRRLDEQATRRFMSPIGMSEEEQEQRQIYKKILEYEQQAKWLLEWRIKLANSPKDPIVISQLVTQILRCEDHPLTKLLMKYQYKIYEKLYPLVSTKMTTLNEIHVPLPESLHPNNNSKESSESKKNDKEDSDKHHQDKDTNKLERVNDEQDSDKQVWKNECLSNTTDESSIVSDIIDVTVNDSKNHEYSEQFVNIECKNNLESFTENTISDLKTAVDQNAKLTEQLSMDNKNIHTSVHSLSKKLERYYSEENMDDLFDDDDDDDKNVEILAEKLELDKVEFNLQRQDSEAYVVLSSKDVHNNSTFRDNLYKFRRPSEIDKVRTMSEEAYVRHLKGVSQDIHNALEKLLVMFSIGYEELGCAEGQDQCYASIEEPFFKPIWKYLLNLFRLSNRTEEIALAYCMTIKQGDLPESYGVSRKLCLVSDIEDKLPFQSAINEIRKLKDHYTMLSKLECVVNVCRLICECVENFYSTKQIEDGEISSTPCVGADDLLPILTYVVVKSGLPQLLSECQAMAEFIHEGYIMGEEGYCLTSIQTAISFLSSPELQNR